MSKVIAALLLSFFGIYALAATSDELLPVDDAFVLTARALSRDRLEVHWQIADGYYLYRHSTKVSVLSGDFQTGVLQLPRGKRHVDEFFGEAETYRQALSAHFSGHARAGVSELQLEIHYQGCADLGVCYPPQKRTLKVALPVSGTTGDALAALGQQLGNGAPLSPAGPGFDPQPLPPEQAFGFEAIAEDGNTLLLRFTPAPGYYLYQGRNQFWLEGADDVSLETPLWPPAQSHHDDHFGEVEVYFDAIEVPLPLLRQHGEAVRITLHATFQGCQDGGICYPPITRHVALDLPSWVGDASPDNPQRSSRSALATTNAVNLPELLFTLGLALLGGLVLNLMPCVLPVLSLKVLGLARSGESRAHARSSALWYTAGVLTTFGVIGLLVILLRSGGQALGWGFQLQQPWFVAVLAYVMFVVGLNLSGLFTLGGPGNFGQTLAAKSGPVGDFFTGVLACIVASPCIAPFMGSALAYALTAPPGPALLVFLVLGLGLALPFLLIAHLPALAAHLPKPGAWMGTLKQFLAFPMYLTALWLLWVLGRQRGVDAMVLTAAGMLATAFGLWLHERTRWRTLNQSGLVRTTIQLASLRIIVLLCVSGQVALLYTPQHPTEQAQAEPYDPTRLHALRDEGHAVFVNMTADWCVTCKLNEARVLRRPAFKHALAAAGAVYMLGDWTDVDPVISVFLEQHNAVGVPLYVVYPPGGGEGRVLPAILSLDAIETALNRTAE